MHEQVLARKKLQDSETRIRQMADELAAAVRVRDDFLAVASHELNTPLTGLKLQLQMRKRHLKKGRLEAFSPNNLQRMLDSDNVQINRLSHLVDDMRDIARIESGKLAISRTKVCLGKLAHEVAGRYADQFAEAGCRLTVNVNTDAEVMCDRFRIEQVIANLLTNAMKYGGQHPIALTVDDSITEIWLAVTDHGPGIGPADMVRIFGQFERAVNRSDVSGLGLGLYISQQIFQAHGGTLNVQSQLGKGACFKVTLTKFKK